MFPAKTDVNKKHHIFDIQYSIHTNIYIYIYIYTYKNVVLYILMSPTKVRQEDWGGGERFSLDITSALVSL